MPCDRTRLTVNPYFHFGAVSWHVFPCCTPRIRRRTLVVFGALIVVCAAALAVGLYFGLRPDNGTATTLNPPDPTNPLPPSESELGIYWNAAVATNGYPCAIIGRLVVMTNIVSTAIRVSYTCNLLVYRALDVTWSVNNHKHKS